MYGFTLTDLIRISTVSSNLFGLDLIGLLNNFPIPFFEIESYGRWSKNPIITSAAVDRLKKCYIADPETNLGVPVELTTTDVRPYFEDQELLRRLPASDFAPHVFDKEQELPMTLPAGSPRDEFPKDPIIVERDLPESSEPPAEIPTAARPAVTEPVEPILG